MKQLSFRTPDEFSEFFKAKSPELTNTIAHAIREAFMFHKKTANLFEICFDESDAVFEISLTSKEWVVALENCLAHYHEWEMHDDEIDTWELIQSIKKW